MKKKYYVLNDKVILIDNYLFPRAIRIEGTNGAVYPINSTGILILSLCDGTRTIEQIIDFVAKRYNIRKSIVKKDARIFLSEKIKQGVLAEKENAIQVNVDLRGREDVVLPYQLSIETTNQCQLKCKHCYNCSGQPREDELTTDEIIGILSEYRSLGGISVMLTGGEIFLKKEVCKLIDYVADNFLRVVILTNGFGIKEEIFEKLRQYKDRIVLQISIDGLAEKHDYIRGVKGAYENTLKNIKRFVSEGVSVSIATTLNEKNLSDVYELTGMIKEIGCASINIGAVSGIGRAKENDITAIDVINEFPTIIEKLREMYQTDEFLVGDNIEEVGEINVIDGVEYENMCGAGYKILHIFADGKIGLCPAHGSIVSKYWIGDLKKHKLEEILKYDNMKNILNIPTPTKDICGDCSMYDECGKCIVSMLNKNKNKCIIKRKLIDEKIINMQE